MTQGQPKERNCRTSAPENTVTPSPLRGEGRGEGLVLAGKAVTRLLGAEGTSPEWHRRVMHRFGIQARGLHQ